jgi:hypothetical protein
VPPLPLALPLPLLAVLRLHLAPRLVDALPAASVLPLPVVKLPLLLAVPPLLVVPLPWLPNVLRLLAALKHLFLLEQKKKKLKIRIIKNKNFSHLFKKIVHIF